MYKSDLTLLYSIKDDEWKNYLSNQLENNAVGDILITHEPLEHVTWPLEPDKNKFSESRLVLVLLSQASLNYLEEHVDHLSDIKRMLRPEKTVGVLFGVPRDKLKHFHDYDFSWEDWSIFPQEDTERIIHAVQALLEQSERREPRPNSSFKLVPRKVYEGRGRVYIILDEPLEENQEIKVLSKETEKTEITIKKMNPYNWQFLVPDSYMRSSSVLKVAISCNGSLIGSQTLKCESRLCQLCNLLSASCGPAELMCDALGVNSYAALDRMLARAFKKRFPKSEICELHIDESTTCCTQAKEEIPTLIHFAARYGLKHLVQELLECPGTYSACNIKNAQGLTPAELAAYFKHHDLSSTLKNFQDLKCSMITRSSSPNNLPSTPLSSNLLSSASPEASCECNDYDIPPSQTIPVSKVEYDYIDEQLPCTTTIDPPILIHGSGSPHSETLFLESQSKLVESQSKLVEINKAYKKGASEFEVMSMFNKWQSTYQVDSEAKSTLENLRNLYAQKNKPRLSKKQSVSFSEFKHLLSKMLPKRKDSTDSQDADNDVASHEVRYKYVKDKPGSKNHHRRLSKTFSTTSYASVSSSSSSDRLSVASEHSDYYDFLTSFKNHPGMGMCAKSRFSNCSTPLDSKKNSAPLPLPRSPLIHPPQNYHSAISKKTSDGNDSSQHSRNNQTEFSQLPSFGPIGTLTSSSPDIEGYDILPFRAPLLVQQKTVPNHVSGFKESTAKKSSQIYDVPSCSMEYDIPRSLPAWGAKAEDSMPLHTKISLTSVSIANGSAGIHNTTSSSFNGFRPDGSINVQPTYGNICFKDILTRRNSIPEEIAPAPPILDEEEYYKFVGAPIPIATAK